MRRRDHYYRSFPEQRNVSSWMISVVFFQICRMRREGECHVDGHLIAMSSWICWTVVDHSKNDFRNLYRTRTLTFASTTYTSRPVTSRSTPTQLPQPSRPLLNTWPCRTPSVPSLISLHFIFPVLGLVLHKHSERFFRCIGLAGVIGDVARYFDRLREGIQGDEGHEFYVFFPFDIFLNDMACLQRHLSLRCIQVRTGLLKSSLLHLFESVRTDCANAIVKVH